MADLQTLTDAIIKGDRATAKTVTSEQIDAGTDPETILNAMIAAMDDIGEKYKNNEVFVPEMLIAARAMKEALAILEPKLVEAGHEPIATAVIGTVQGDLHDIGKNLVAMMWKGANVDVIDLGTNVKPDRFIEAAKEHRAQIIGLSTLLTTTMPAMKQAVTEIRDAMSGSVKIIIGGAPINDAFADEIGADAYAPDAASSVETVRQTVAS